MWKSIVALMALLVIGVTGASADCGTPSCPPEQPSNDGDCIDCWANQIIQHDTQTIENVRLGPDQDFWGDQNSVGVGNEGLSAAVIVTPKAGKTAGDLFTSAPFGKIEQTMKQTISNLGVDKEVGTGAKGLTWNKAIQAAWMTNQGLKEAEGYPLTLKKEGALISQTTLQTTKNIMDYDSREDAKILNLDNKLAMIVDDLNAVIKITAEASSSAKDTQSSTGTITNDVDIDIDTTGI